MPNPFAIVTGASSGIGLELAKIAAVAGYDLLIAADQPLAGVADQLQETNAAVQMLEVDLSTFEGVDRLIAAKARSRCAAGMLVVR